MWESGKRRNAGIILGFLVWAIITIKFHLLQRKLWGRGILSTGWKKRGGGLIWDSYQTTSMHSKYAAGHVSLELKRKISIKHVHWEFVGVSVCRQHENHEINVIAGVKKISEHSVSSGVLQHLETGKMRRDQPRTLRRNSQWVWRKTWSMCYPGNQGEFQRAGSDPLGQMLLIQWVYQSGLPEKRNQ